MQCPHPESEPDGQICQHLLAHLSQTTQLDHYRRFTGRGIEYVLLCPECATVPGQTPGHLCWVCQDCMEDVACGKRRGEQGRVEVRERDAGLTLQHQTLRLPTTLGRIISAVPLEGQQWLVLDDRLDLIVIDAESRSFHHFQTLKNLGISQESKKAAPSPFTLIASGHLVLVASTYGRYGVVADLRTGKITMTLNRGDYRLEHCRFSAAFFGHRNRLLLAHATDWNRLDISDPTTGTLLTPREPTSYRHGQKEPEHYLDYFHCGLHVSPNDKWIVSNGWVWHPVGAVVVWDLQRWLENNVWESEDGKSRRWVCQRDYYWDGPVCWTDNNTLAVWGHGRDDTLLIPGIRLFNIESGEELPGFVGPMVTNNHLRSSGIILFDEFLFSYDDGCEFAVWDIATGEQLLRDETFRPLAYQSSTKTFLSQNFDREITLTTLRKVRES